MIRAVLFDVGETLITSMEMIDTFQAILKEKDIEIDLEEIREAHEKASKEFLGQKRDIRPTGKGDFNKVYASWNDEVVKELGLKEKNLGKYISKRWFDVVGLKAYDDAVVVLNRLSAMGLRIGIVTNGYQEELETVLEKINGPLKTNMFDVIVGRDTVGAAKPDPRPFLHAAGSLGLKPDEIVYVGDSFHNDYEGSQGVGMKPVLILRGRKPPAYAPDDITTIQTLDEIMNLLD